MGVYPDGKSCNLTSKIQRTRYRYGYDKALAWVSPSKAYKVTFQPIDTSNYLYPWHKLRVAISSSNFPHFDRNLNTGGNDYGEAQGVIARNEAHHDSPFPSKILLTVARGRAEPATVSRPKEN